MSPVEFPVVGANVTAGRRTCEPDCESASARESAPWWAQLSEPKDLDPKRQAPTGLEPRAVEPEHRLPADRTVVTAAGTHLTLVANADYRPETTPEKVELGDARLAEYLSGDDIAKDSFAATDWVKLRQLVEAHVAEHFPMPLANLSPSQALAIATQITRDVESHNQVLDQMTREAAAEADRNNGTFDPFFLEFAAQFDTQGVEAFFEADNDGVCRHRITIARAIFRVLQSLQDPQTNQLANTSLKKVHAPTGTVGHAWLACYTVQPDGSVLVTQAEPTLDDPGEVGRSLGLDFSLLPGYAYHWQRTLLTALGDTSADDFRNDWYHANTWQDVTPEQARGKTLTGEQRTLLSQFVGRWDDGGGWFDRARAGNGKIEEAEMRRRVVDLMEDFEALPWQLRPDAWAALTPNVQQLGLRQWWRGSSHAGLVVAMAKARGQPVPEVTPWDVLDAGGFARLSEVLGAMALPKQVEAFARLTRESRATLRAYRSERGLPPIQERPPAKLVSDADYETLRTTRIQ